MEDGEAAKEREHKEHNSSRAVYLYPSAGYKEPLNEPDRLNQDHVAANGFTRKIVNKA